MEKVCTDFYLNRDFALANKEIFLEKIDDSLKNNDVELSVEEKNEFIEENICYKCVCGHTYKHRTGLSRH